MTSQTFTATGAPHCFAGRAVIASGVIGMLAVGSLIAHLAYRGPRSGLGLLMQNFHDVGVVLQFLLMIPVVFGLQKLSEQKSPGMRQTTLFVSVGALSFTVLFLLLGITKIIAAVLYMFPQGVFGVSLMIICWQMRGIFSRGLRWFGMVVGLGLALVGTFPTGYAIFVDTTVLQIPAASDEAVQKVPHTPANQILHFILVIGSLMGVATLPIWTLLLGRRLLRKKILVEKSANPDAFIKTKAGINM